MTIFATMEKCAALQQQQRQQQHPRSNRHADNYLTIMQMNNWLDRRPDHLEISTNIRPSAVSHIVILEFMVNVRNWSFRPRWRSMGTKDETFWANLVIFVDGCGYMTGTMAYTKLFAELGDCEQRYHQVEEVPPLVLPPAQSQEVAAAAQEEENIGSSSSSSSSSYYQLWSSPIDTLELHRIVRLL